jgi:hypothetical protein
MKCLAAIGLALLLADAQALADLTQLDWPSPGLPADAAVQSVGENISINGVPARIYTFTTVQTADEVVAEFRKHLDGDFVRAKQSPLLQGQVDVGGRVGDFWLALQLHQKGSRTKGTWSATPRFMPDAIQTVVKPAGFPDSARLIQQVDSFDAGKRSQMAMGIDPSPVDGVAARLEEQMHDQGFVRQALPAVHWPAPDRYVAVFGNGREELWVTLQQQRAGTAVSINRLSALEVLK